MQASESDHARPEGRIFDRFRPAAGGGRSRNIFREQLLTISSEERTRIVRLGPKSQIVILFASAIVVIWIMAATSIALVGIVRPPSGDSGNHFQKDLADRVVQLESETSELNRLNAKYQEWIEAAFDLAFDQSVELADLRKQVVEYERITAARDAAASGRPAMAGDDLPSLQGFRSQELSTDAVPAHRVEALFEAIDGTVESLEVARAQIATLTLENADLRQNAEFRQKQSEQIVSEILDAVVAVSTDLEQIFKSAGVSTKHLEDAARSAYHGKGGPSDSIPPDLDSGSVFPPGSGLDSLIEEVNRLDKYRMYYRGTPFGRPVHARHRLTSGFAMRRHPITKKIQMHEGIDLAAASGTPIHSTGDGIVTFAGRNGSYGLQVKIRHLGGISSTYAHLLKIYVKEGQSVSRNQQIGAMGSTGLSTGPHLHYEIIVDGKAIDPMTFIKAEANVH